MYPQIPLYRSLLFRCQGECMFPSTKSMMTVCYLLQLHRIFSIMMMLFARGILPGIFQEMRTLQLGTLRRLS